MATRTSLTGVAVNSGYVQLIHVGDDGGITSTKTLLYDGNGTATSLLLGTVDAEVVLGTSAGNDFLVGNGSNVLLIEGDTVAMTFTGDASAGSDFVIHDASNPVMTVATDTNDTTFLDGHQILISGTTTGLQIGNAGTDKLGLYDATPVVQASALTTVETTLTNAGTAGDYAVQALTNSGPFGFVTASEGETVVEVVLNNQARINELEAALDATTGVGIVA